MLSRLRDPGATGPHTPHCPTPVLHRPTASHTVPHDANPIIALAHLRPLQIQTFARTSLSVSPMPHGVQRRRRRLLRERSLGSAAFYGRPTLQCPAPSPCHRKSPPPEWSSCLRLRNARLFRRSHTARRCIVGSSQSPLGRRTTLLTAARSEGSTRVAALLGRLLWGSAWAAWLLTLEGETHGHAGLPHDGERDRSEGLRAAPLECWPTAPSSQQRR